MQFAPDFYNFC